MTTINEFLPHRVKVKATWGAEWVTQADLYCEEFTHAVAPDMSRALLCYQMGEVMGYGRHAFATRTPLDLSDKYVKIEVDQPGEADPLVWIGIVVSERRTLYGTDEAVREAKGKQYYTAYGLEYLLERAVVNSSYVLDADGQLQEIGRGIGFNLGGSSSHLQVSPNAAPHPRAPDGFPAFSSDLPNADYWSGRDIIDYLLKRHTLKDAAGNVQVPFELSVQSNVFHIDTNREAMRCDGQSVYALLSAICDRRRLMGWRVVADDTSAKVLVFTFNEAQIGEGLAPILASPLKTTYDFDRDHAVELAELVTDSSSQYAQVIAIGERRVGCFSMGEQASPNFINDPKQAVLNDWTSDLQAEYEAGISTDLDYATKTAEEKWEGHRAFRQQDKFASVFRYFKFSPLWRGFVNNLADAVCPTYNQQTGELNGGEQVKMWMPGLRILPWVPLEEGADYEGVGLQTNRPDDALITYRRPFAIFNVNDDGGYHDQNSDSRFALLENPPEARKLGQAEETGGRYWAGVVRPRPDGLSFEVEVRGAPQHIIGLGYYTAPDAISAADDLIEANWNGMIFTVAIEFDERAQSHYPPQLAAAGDNAKILYVEVPGARLDYLAPQTAIGVNTAGQIIRNTNGRILNDDTGKLNAISRIAYEWYKRPRKSLYMAVYSRTPAVEAGDLITTIGDGVTQLEVNSVVTQVRQDMRSGYHYISTAFGELDARRLV